MQNEVQKNKTPEEKSIVYGVYIKLIEGIKHFDSIQAIYRTMTSTLLLAAFFAIGFLFSSKGPSLPFNNLCAVIFICVLAIAAITTIGLLDLVFQERLVVANFVEAIKLERKYTWIPSIHHNMVFKGTHHRH